MSEGPNQQGEGGPSLKPRSITFCEPDEISRHRKNEWTQRSAYSRSPANERPSPSSTAHGPTPGEYVFDEKLVILRADHPEISNVCTQVERDSSQIACGFRRSDSPSVLFAFSDRKKKDEVTGSLNFYLRVATFTAVAGNNGGSLLSRQADICIQFHDSKFEVESDALSKCLSDIKLELEKPVSATVEDRAGIIEANAQIMAAIDPDLLTQELAEWSDATRHCLLRVKYPSDDESEC